MMRLVLGACCALVVGGCNTKKNADSGAAGSGSAASVAAAPSVASAAASQTTSKAAAEVARLQQTVSPEEIQKVTNPGNKPVYSGPTGTVTGSVRMTGDAVVPLDLYGIQIDGAACGRARETYANVFREGPGRTLADVLVAVTQYEGHLPVPAQPERVEIRGCAFDSRTVAVMFGQGLQIVNLEGEAAAPQLLGVYTPALLVGIPGGDPVNIQPQKIGLHRLVDRSHEFAFADVYVVPYPTLDVTGLDGRFEIKGVPVGPAKLNALLPVLQQSVERSVEVKANATTDVGVIDLKFDAKEYAKLAAEAKAKIKQRDPAEEAQIRAKAKLLAEELVQTARGASSAAQGAATVPVNP